MLRFHIVSLFPSFFDSVLSAGLMGRALEKGIVQVDVTDPRSFSTDRHRHVDDRPYGGGPGMVMQAGPVAQALRSLKRPGRMLCMAPSGRAATQSYVRELAREEDITLVCGRYEGLDGRLFDLFPLEPVAVGDIVLNGGETAALALLEAIARLVPGFMGKEESGEDESFSHGLLEYPHFTRPPCFEGLEVPKVLEQGNHREIAAWRRSQSLGITLARRPELLEWVELGRDDVPILREAHRSVRAGNLSLCLVDAPGPTRWEKALCEPMEAGDVAELTRLAAVYGVGHVHLARQGRRSTRAQDRLPAQAPSGPEAVQAAVPATAQGTQSQPSSVFAEGQWVWPSLAALLAELGKNGPRPTVVGLAGWPKKGLVQGYATVRQAAERGPVLLVLGTRGHLGKEVAACCDMLLRPPLFLGRGAELGASALVTVVLDRLVGDFG